MPKLIFECDYLGTNTTTNECYDCSKYPNCELCINKITEEDENESDDIDISNMNAKINNNDDVKDSRWWMN